MLCIKAVQFLAAAIQADKNNALEAVKRKGGALQFVSAAFQADKEIVLEAVKQDGLAIQYAAPGLRGDKEIVLEAVKQNAEALKYAAPALQEDKEIGLYKRQGGETDRSDAGKRPRLEGGAIRCGRCRRAVAAGGAERREQRVQTEMSGLA
jgi:hypothetical protein